MSTLQRFLRIARMGLFLGATVFGGVAVAYPVVRERAAELGEISGEEVDALYALSVVLPGPSFLNLWGSVCARVGGLAGAFIGQVALLTPAFLIVMLLPLTSRIGFFAVRADGALYGAIWGTAGLLLATGIDGVRKQKTGAQRAVIGGGLTGLLLGLHPLLLMGLVVGLGAASSYLPAVRKAA